jgi:putative Mn2+ efflux pump MntP
MLEKIIAVVILALIGILYFNNKFREHELQIRNDILQQQLEQQTIYFNGYKEGNTAN